MRLRSADGDVMRPLQDLLPCAPRFPKNEINTPTYYIVIAKHIIVIFHCTFIFYYEVRKITVPCTINLFFLFYDTAVTEAFSIRPFWIVFFLFDFQLYSISTSLEVYYFLQVL